MDSGGGSVAAARLLRPRPAGRVRRSFAFVDICGFTEFTERHGDERAVELVADLRGVLREGSAARGVRIVKWLGDGAMLSATTAVDLVALVLDVQERLRASDPPIEVRAGIDAGHVILFEGDDYIGRPVNVASRLCELAPEGRVLATLAVAAQLPHSVCGAGETDVVVRGLDVPVAVRELRGTGDRCAPPVGGR